MDSYNSGNASFFLTDITKWWWLPDETGGKTLVVSVKSSQAELWVIAYATIITLIFMAVCELTTAVVLTVFKLGTSGTRHAMLVAYYNAGGPSATIKPMFYYLWNALWRCRKGGKWSVDWNAFQASAGLLFLAVALLAGVNTARFLVTGKNLYIASAAQVNPEAMFYPSFDIPYGNTPGDVVDQFKGLFRQAAYQASQRRRKTERVLQEKRIQFYSAPLVADGTLLGNGRRQNGTAARFEYQYSLTGFEMGLRDAPELVFRVRGSCATSHGRGDIEYQSFSDPNIPSKLEEVELYPYYGDRSWSSLVFLSRENYTTPWAQFVTKFDPETLKQNAQYGGYTFMIIPHTAWRLSNDMNPNPDPWYETEVNPASVEGKSFYPPYRVKSARPALRCTQNDTYTYKGKTVNHVTKLSQLPGLKLSPFIRNFVFGQEFGSPVFSKLLGNLPFEILASTPYFIPNQRQLDATRVSTEQDFRVLVDTAFLYSREVVRNTVLLYSPLLGQNDTHVKNATRQGDLVKNADIFLYDVEVAALSVLVLVVTPPVCVFLWILVFLWSTGLSLKPTLDNKGYRSRYDLRLTALKAVALFQNLDEELSRKRRWSGRNTDAPYIRDLDAEQQSADISTAENPSLHTSQYAKPKIRPVSELHELPQSPEESLSEKRPLLRSSHGEPEQQQFDVVMTRVWDRDLDPVPRKHIL